jgi:hypothetical protein
MRPAMSRDLLGLEAAVALAGGIILATFPVLV